MCNCTTMCRTGEETCGGKYPPSVHHPRCEDYVTERFIRISHDGASYVEPMAALDSIEDDECVYLVSSIHITRDQFEGLDEFQGF